MHQPHEELVACIQGLINLFDKIPGSRDGAAASSQIDLWQQTPVIPTEGKLKIPPLGLSLEAGFSK